MIKHRELLTFRYHWNVNSLLELTPSAASSHRRHCQWEHKMQYSSYTTRFIDFYAVGRDLDRKFLAHRGSVHGTCRSVVRCCRVNNGLFKRRTLVFVIVPSGTEGFRPRSSAHGEYALAARTVTDRLSPVAVVRAAHTRAIQPLINIRAHLCAT